jgi:hypothetical protein
MSINEVIAEITEIAGNEESEGSEGSEENMENAEIVLDTASGFDVILNNKIKEINELYELKTKNKKMTSNVNEINFMDKKLYNKINAAIDKKYKESKKYKKKCEEEVQNAL